MAIENGSPSIADREVVDSEQLTLENENRIVVHRQIGIGKSRKSGNDGDIAKCFWAATSAMEELKAKFDFAAAPQLLYFLAFRFAKLFVKLGRKPDAEGACEFPLRNFDGGGSATVHNLYLATKDILIRIRGCVKEQDWESVSREYIRADDRSMLTLLLMGFIRETGHPNTPKLDLKIDAEGFLTKALEREGETSNDAVKNATIRVILAMYHYRKESTSSRKACLSLLERAITDFKRVECRCEPHFVMTDNNDELFGAADRPRHLLLADALLLQGIVQSQLRLYQEAQASFEEGLILVERHCMYREYLFHCSLISLIPVESPSHVRSHGSDFMLSKPVINQMEYVPLPRHHLSDAIGECSMSSAAQVELRGEASEVSSEIVSRVTTSDLLHLFLASAIESYPNHAIMLSGATELFPEVFDILGTRTAAKSCCMLHDNVEIVTRCFMKIVFDALEKSGKDENIAMYVERVVEDLEELHKKASGVFHTTFQVFLIFRCAKVLLRFGLKYKELIAGVCLSAMQIMKSHPDMDDLLELGIGYVVAYRIGEDTNLKSRVDWNKFFESDPLIKEALTDGHESHCASEKLTSLLTGFIRETKDNSDPVFHLETVKDILEKSLKREEETTNNVSNKATIRLTLAICHLEGSNSSQLKCRTLLKEAISGFRRAECMCPRYSMKSGFYDELFGATECPRHVLLADALMYQGIDLRCHGLLEKAKKSFEEGKSLVELYCNDDGSRRLKSFILQLVDLQGITRPTNPIYGYEGLTLLSRLNVPGYDTSPVESSEDQYMWGLLERLGLPGKDALFQMIRTGGDHPLQLKEFLSWKVRALEYVQQCAESGFYLMAALVQSGLCYFCSLYEGYETEAKEYLYLAVEALVRMPEDLTTSTSWNFANEECRQLYINVLMSTGHTAMLPRIMELDHARKVLYKAYQLTQPKLEDLTQLTQPKLEDLTQLTQPKLEDLTQPSTEDYVVHYFETTKHVCVALANCENLRATQLRRNIRGQEKEWKLALLRSLMWAERGKGGMLSMLFNYGRLRWESEEGVDDDIESGFMENEDVALEFLRSPIPKASHAKGTVFVEYTFVNPMELLIIVMWCGHFIFTVRLDLSESIDEETQLEAEKELQRAEVLLKARKSSRPDTEAWNQVFTESLKGNGFKANGEQSKVLSVLYTHEVNRAPFNRWIPGMVAGIQRRAEEAQQKRMRERDFKPEEEEIKRLLQKLHAVLIEPIEKLLHLLFKDSNPKGDKTIVFVPHEDLGVVPFAALHQEKLPYLIEQYAISVSPSIRCSKRMEFTYKLKGTEGSPVLVGRRGGYPDSFGNPDPFGTLEEAHKEVDNVAQALEATAYLKIVDDDTHPDMKTRMKERVMDVIPKASWVHLSVHGEISPQFPQGSLVFGNGDTQRLSAAEIINSGLYKSTWEARCVIASACQSGLGSVAGGGIMGFARAFMLAGVPSCVLSMWEVNQTFCTSFMGKLYVELRSGKDIGHAIQSTTTSMIQEFKEHPEDQIPAKPRKSRFGRHEPAKVVTPEPVRKWSILDWAAFSCFGFPGVKLPDISDHQA